MTYAVIGIGFLPVIIANVLSVIALSRSRRRMEQSLSAHKRSLA